MIRSPNPVAAAFRDDRGVTLTETMIAGLVGAVLVGMMITWFGAITTVDGQQRRDDMAMEALRDARALLGRDLRTAQYLTAAEPTRVSMWLDVDRDGTVDTAELITWTITSEGALERSDDGGASEAVAQRLVTSASGFSFDAVDPADVTLVRFDLSVQPDAGSGERHLGSEVLIRNSRLEADS